MAKSMVTKLLKIIFFGGLCSLLFIEVLFAGRDGEYSDRYPKFSIIVQTDSSILFAGAWVNRYIIAERMMNGKWQVYTSTGNKYRVDYPTIAKVPKGLLFMGGGNYQKFLYQSKTWEIITIKSKAERQAYSNLYYSSQDKALDSDTKKIVEKIKLPPPSYNAFKRWRFLPDTHYQLEANIGQAIKKEDDLWFLIDFYAGEGSIGIGGIGLYDIKENKIGVIRDKILASCSEGLLANYGDTLIIATNHSGEYGIYGDRGIVLIDIKEGLLANLPKAQDPLDGDYFLRLKLIDDVLWISTDRSIISWDLKNDLWQTFKFESLIANKKCPIYRRAISYSDFSNGGLPRKIDYDSTFIVSHFNPGDTIECKWPSSKLSEIISNKEISGWMSKEKYDRLVKWMKRQGIGRYPLEILYSDSTLKRPYHSFQTSQLMSAEVYDNTVYLTINSAWINMDDVEPVLDESSVLPSPQIKWHSILSSANDVKSQAFLTFDKEQEEIKAKTPILDTTFTFSDTMDLFDTFYGIIDAKWLPRSKLDKNQSPQGIRLNYYTELWLKNNKLEYKGRILSIGDTVSAVEGDAHQSYKIMDYKTDSNHLIELRIHYTLVMVPSRH